jgi:hypothetical protein
MEPDAPSGAADAAYDIASVLATAAGAHEIANAASDGDDGALLLDTLMTHELAIGHALMARLAAHADGFIRRIGQVPEGKADRAVAEASRLTGAVARMMERYRLGFETLAKVRAMSNGAKRKRVVRLAWGDGTGEGAHQCECDNGGENRSSGRGGRDSGHPASRTDAFPPPDPPNQPRTFAPDHLTVGAARLRRGCLRNGNPSGDFLAAPRCGARTRAGHPCRQPAMANGRCRLHGGKSAGPRSAAGLAVCRAARLRHGA